jgi:uncharacterized protein
MIKQDSTLIAKRCNNCNTLSIEPAESCCRCGSEDLINETLSGAGTLYSYTVVHMGFGHMAERAPYLLAVVHLKEGIFITTIVDDIDLENIAIGQEVKFKAIEENVGPVFQGESA